MTEIVTNYYSKLIVTITDQTGAAVDVTGATITAALTNTLRNATLAGPYAVNLSDAQGDPENGIIAIDIPAADTADITTPWAYLEVSVLLDGFKQPYLSVTPDDGKIKVIPGRIS